MGFENHDDVVSTSIMEKHKQGSLLLVHQSLSLSLVELTLFKKQKQYEDCYQLNCLHLGH